MPPRTPTPTGPRTTPNSATSSSRKKSALRRQPAQEQLFRLVEPPPRRNDRANRPPPVAPHSQDKGPHRDGYSERKCRATLVRECSRIPRNFNYCDGIHMVVSTLREHLGDENLDLSIGVLYEFIEVNDTTETWEEGSAYRRWGHDHALRNEDFCCPHTLRLANVVAGQIKPTERLRQWRENQKNKLAASSETAELRVPRVVQSPDIPRPSPALTSHGIRNRHSWQINHSFYRSDPRIGTQVVYCPTPAQVNEMAFMETAARGVRYHAGIQTPTTPQVVDAAPTPNNSLPITPPPTPSPPTVKAKKSFIIRNGCNYILSPLRRKRSKKEKAAEDDVALTRTAESVAGSSDSAVNETIKEAELMNGPTRTYVEEDGTLRIVQDFVPLPPNAKVNGMFSRKFGIVGYESQLPTEIESCSFSTAEDKALKDEYALKVSIKEEKKVGAPVLSINTNHLPFKGPFTAHLFKDGGLDFRWKPATATVPEDEADAIVPASAR